MNTQNPTSFAQDNTENFNLRELLLPYLLNWKAFVLSIILTLTLAFLYLRYASPTYNAAMSIQVKDDRRGGMSSELAAFSEITQMSGVKDNVENEVEVLRSRTLMEKTLKKLHLEVVYFTAGKVKSFEIYKNTPIIIEWLKLPTRKEKEISYSIEGINFEKFSIFDNESNKLGTYSYGEKINLKENGSLVVSKGTASNFTSNYELNFELRPLQIITNDYKTRLNISNIGKNTSIIELSLTDALPEKAEDILNTLIESYNLEAIKDKEFVAKNTSRFIEGRLNLIAKELDDVEEEVETFKKENKLVDVETEGKIFRENATAFEKKAIETETEINIVETLKAYNKTASTDDLLPATLLASENSASPIIEQYNLLVLQKEKQASSAGPKNTIVIQLDQKIKALKRNIDANLTQSLANLNIVKRDLNRQQDLLGGKLAKVPTQEKLFKEIFRKQAIKDAIYSYLLQKREETEISLAVTEPNAKVIDAALANNIPVSPKKSIIYIAALLLGLLIPAGIIYLITILDTKVKSRLDIERATTIPIIGDVPHALDGEERLVASNSRTNTAEALRIVSTNLNFILNEVPEDRARMIFLTSTFPKEGKTFISVNLAATIALSEKKILLIGMDIRNPKIDEYLDVPEKGVTNFLADKSNKPYTDYVKKMEGYENFYVLPGGIIPPNPAELLMGKRVSELFEAVKKDFDYVIVDTAPVSLVTDTLLIAKYADAFVYVTRAYYLEKRVLALPQQLHIDKKLPNMSILVNDTDIKKGYGYGYGYGYGVEVEKDSILNRMKKWFKPNSI
ncbi:GumC family protein [Flavobacterium ardleyense]|uniref:non-specific protein-tyrosine kinase n=1 Tax=Flavobacterium ardleyense TaxID=2038737 RepID=A0ABW5Z4H5_9FLAO